MLEKSTSTLSASQFQPLSNLAPFTNNFHVKVRVMSKGNLQNFTNKRTSAQSSLFSMMIMDSAQTKIQVTFYGQLAKDFFGEIE